MCVCLYVCVRVRARLTLSFTKTVLSRRVMLTMLLFGKSKYFSDRMSLTHTTSATITAILCFSSAYLIFSTN
jgi:hypothetical protein